MTCGCSLCLVRAGGPPPKLDGCRCPDQVHVSMMCFVAPRASPKPDRFLVLKKAAIDVIDRIKANDVDFSEYGGQAEVNELEELCRKL